jgi:hypothetical protein
MTLLRFAICADVLTYAGPFFKQSRLAYGPMFLRLGAHPSADYPEQQMCGIDGISSARSDPAPGFHS